MATGDRCRQHGLARRADRQDCPQLRHDCGLCRYNRRPARHHRRHYAAQYPMKHFSEIAAAPESSGGMRIQREVLTEELFAEIMPLGQKSWDECSEIKGETCSFHGERGFQIQPDKDRYL